MAWTSSVSLFVDPRQSLNAKRLPVLVRRVCANGARAGAGGISPMRPFHSQFSAYQPHSQQFAAFRHDIATWAVGRAKTGKNG